MCRRKIERGKKLCEMCTCYKFIIFNKKLRAAVGADD